LYGLKPKSRHRRDLAADLAADSEHKKMPDTIRSQAAILALLADNTSGDISPQDLRDAIVSLYAETPASMTVSAFDTETTNGTANPNYRRVVYLSDGLYVCVWNGTAWEYYYRGRKVTRPVSSAYAWINQGSATLSTSNGGMKLTAPTGSNLRIQKAAAPATPYTITAGFLFHPARENGSGAGLIFRQSSDGKVHHILLQLTAAAPANSLSFNSELGSYKHTNPTTFSASYFVNGNTEAVLTADVWLRIADDGTNRIVSYSRDGETFATLHSVGRTDFLTADEYGFFATALGTMTLFHLAVA
jgi:hypothetical protein